MQSIILEANNTENEFIFNIADLEARLNQLTDSRDKRGKIYPLGMILTMIILAKLSGEDKPSGITEWIRLRCDIFVKIFGCKHKRMPCLNTIRTVLEEVISLEEVETVFLHYLHDTYGGQESELIAIDGKAMCGTIPKGSSRGVHLLAAYLPEEGIVLKQIAVETKKNEISAAPELLEGINVKNKIICADAMQTQRKFSSDVLSRGGDYILFLKGNQSTLLADVEQFFKPARVASGWHPPELPQQVATMSNKGHGRVEKRTLTLMTDDEQFLNWPGVHQVFKLVRERTHIRAGRKSVEVVYGITSCASERVSAEQLQQWIRCYWGIENGLHYRRDVTLREDAAHTQKTTLAKMIAAINNFIVGLAQKLDYFNLASARRIFDAKIAAQFSSVSDY